MGVWIRDRKWRQRGTGIKVADPRQDCFFDPANEGLVDVQHKQVVDRLLAHPTEFEVAWEKHGVIFDVSGKVVDADGVEEVRSYEPGEAATEVPEPVERPKRGRPRKG